jgi:Putative peptidoglycan binding domain
MGSFRTCQVMLLGAFLSAAPAFATRTHRAATSGHAHHKVLHHQAHKVQGQRGIDPQRATEIQNALIREHYLSGPASGQWDSTTEAAMQKYQSDHGWQTKLTPDSRALISLGLGPSTASGPQTLPANTYTAPSVEPAEAGTLASIHSISQ